MTSQPTEALSIDTSRGCRGYEHNLTENWNGNVAFGGRPVIPSSIEELCDICKSSQPPIRAVGRGHSFTPLAECTGGTLVSMARLAGIVDFVPPTSKNEGSITVQGGATYTDVIQHLGTRGALTNLPSCPQFTVSGAIATATHGSGVDIFNLATDIIMLEFVQADGTLTRYTRDDDDDDNILQKVRVHLGCLGIVSCLTLKVVPYYQVEAIRYDDMPLQLVIDSLPKLWKSCDSLSVWSSGMGQGHGTGTCWITFRHFVTTNNNNDDDSKDQDHRRRDEWIKSHQELLQNTGALCDRAIPRYCTDPNDIVLFTPTGRGPWHDMLTLTMQDGKETSMKTVDLQAEFFVPLENAQQALSALWDATREWSFSSPWGYTGGDIVMGDVDAMEFRQIKGGDGAWLSPHPVNSFGIHVSFNRNANIEMVHEHMIPTIEAALKPFSPRAHWGKLGKMTFEPEYVQELYGRNNDLDAFRELCNKHDPTGKFRNAHVSRMLFGA